MTDASDISREGAAWAAARAIEAEMHLDPHASSEEIAQRALSITRPDVQEAFVLGLLDQDLSSMSPAAIRMLALVTRLHEGALQVSIADIADIQGVSADTVTECLREITSAADPTVHRHVEKVVRDYQQDK
jgi:hypothetical protein